VLALANRLSVHSHQLSLDALQIMPPGATMKAKKGKKQDTIKSDLAHILGYTGADMDPVGPPSPGGSEKDTAAAGDFAFIMLNTWVADCLHLCTFDHLSVET